MVNRIIVIQCAERKTQKSWQWRDRQVVFVANRNKYTESDPVPYEPDETIPDTNMTWRHAFLDHYRNKRKPDVLDDADELPEAWKLYYPQYPFQDIYKCLVNKCGKEKVFILSAGWGLVNADFQLPPYNITFTSEAHDYARISVKELLAKLLRYNPLDGVTDEDTTIYFFGGKHYRKLLYRYTDSVPVRKVVIYYYCTNKDAQDKAQERENEHYEFRRYNPKEASRRTWYYECARRFIKGGLDP